ncbi:MAG: transposase [Planctomycetes bacterium]|nr:transposase [Planctomycetota bacterium]
MSSIFQKSNSSIEKIFEDAGSPKKVMCIPMDYAKKTHVALACNGAGDQLRQRFNVHNNPEGVQFVLKIADGLCRKHSIRPEHVIFAGEDCGGFCFNFVHALASTGRMIVGVNAGAAAKERENQIASTDELDLRGIASLVIHKKCGRTIGAEHGSAVVLRQLTHHRNSLVKARSASAHRTHHLVDQLLPGFLDEAQSGICPFSQASLWLMSERFSPKQLHARQTNVLLRKFRSFQVHQPAETVRKLKHLAESVLPTPVALCETLQICLGNEVRTYSSLDACVHQMQIGIAKRLASTPGAMLTTVQGIGMTLASGLYAELGDPARRRPAHQMASFAGIVDRLKQTGGPEKEAHSRGRSRRGNRVVKNLVVDTSIKMGMFGHPELKADHSRRVAAGQDVRFTMGRKMLRTSLHLIDHCDFFLPPSLRRNASRNDLRAYYQHAWTKVLVKWRNSGAIQEAYAPGAPLEEWHLMLNDLYGLNLSKKSPQAWQLRPRQQ